MFAISGCGSRLPNDGGHATGEAVQIPDPSDTVATTFHPTTWMTRYLIGGNANVTCPLPDGEDPISWTPDDDAIATYQSAKLIITNGAGFEKWIDKVTLPTSRIVDTTAELKQPLIRYENAVTHQHGPAGEHSHEGIDGHTWLDPLIAKHQAARIAAALRKTWPQHVSRIDENLGLLDKQLDDLHERLLETGYQMKQKDIRLLCSHPAYNYLARRYGWKVKNLDLDPGEPLTDAQVVALVKDQDPAKTLMLWESEPVTESVDKLAAAGVKSVLFSPCENKPPGNGPDQPDQPPGISSRTFAMNYWDVMTWNIGDLNRAIADK